MNFFHHAKLYASSHIVPTLLVGAVVIAGVSGGTAYAVTAHNTASPQAATSHTTAPTPSSHSPAKGRRKPVSGAALVRLVVAAVAKGTGQTPKAVLSSLKSGSSVNTVAGSKASLVETRILTTVKKRMDAAVKAGKITAAQEAAYLGLAKSRLTTLFAEPGPKFLQDVAAFAKLIPAGPKAPLASPKA